MARSKTLARAATVVLATLLAGCNPEPVEIFSDGELVWNSQLGGDRLWTDDELELDDYVFPDRSLDVRVVRAGRMAHRIRELAFPR